MFKTFASYYKPHIRLFIIDTICALLIAGIDLIFPLGTKYILNAENLEKFKATNNIKIIVLIGIGLLILYILRVIFQFVLSYWGHKMGARIERDMRLDLFRKLQTLDHEFFDEHKTGVLMSNLTNHLHDISEMSHHVPEDIIISFFMFIGSFIILSTISIKLTSIIFIFIVLLVIFSIQRRKQQRDAFNEVRRSHGELNSQIESSITGIQLTKAFNNEEFEIERFKSINKLYEEQWGEAYKQMGIYNSGNGFLLSLLNLAVLVFGAIFVIYDKGVDTVDLLTYFLYINFLTKPINRLVDSMQQTRQGMSGFQKFYEIMNLKPKIVNRPNCIEMKNVKGKIEFKDVSFRYNNMSTNVLTHFSLTINPGKKVAIIGETGVGKTTISKLIPRFYECLEGDILIDDISNKDYELSSMRENIGHVQQDVFIFYGSIKDNILYGKPDATDEEIIEACKNADIYDYIISLDDGFDSIVGDRGIKLSGGQKQRIAIARLFLKQPKIIILDEATSSLDNETERIVQKAFDTLAKDKTIIIIAHRLSTIKDVDEIVVLGNQGIIEKGSHQELLTKNGRYAELLNK